jgi:hypothetical protein
MKTVCSFLTKFSSLIAWVHSCFDRVIFKGHLPISQPATFERFVDYVLKIRRTDFLKVRGPGLPLVSFWSWRSLLPRCLCWTGPSRMRRRYVLA